MEKVCSKLLLIKSGSKIITTDNNGELSEFELLEDLQVNVECVEYYNVQKTSTLPKKSGTSID